MCMSMHVCAYSCAHVQPRLALSSQWDRDDLEFPVFPPHFSSAELASMPQHSWL